MQPYTEALERALGGIVSRAKGELDLLKAQSDAVVAAANAKVAEAETKLSGIEARITERLASLKDGEAGIAGADGRDGVDGEPGRDGADVDMLRVVELIAEQASCAVMKLPPPERGEKGEPGRDGADGHDVEEISVVQNGAELELGFTVNEVRTLFTVELPAGPQGEKGEAGATGEAGKHGKLPGVQAWAEGVQYEGAVRSHAGATWQAQRDTANEPPHEDWTCIAARGADGAEGASLNPRRLWEADGEYKRLDLVALNGGCFVALSDDPGACPGEGWMRLAQPGKRGERGDKGERGERGLPGPSITSASIDGEGIMTLMNADGSEVKCDLYPLLSSITR